MLMRKAALAMSVSLALAACASRPQHHTELSVGRIVDRSDREGGPSGHRVHPLSIPAGNVTIQLTSSPPGRSEADYYLYRIRTASGRMLQTQSTLPFNVGDCVKFWHPPLTSNTLGDHHFVSGTLEKGTGCTWP